MRAQKFWNSRKLGPEIFWTQIGKSSEMSIDIDHQMARQIWHRTATNSTTIIRKINTHSLNILVSEFCEVNKCIPYEVPNLVLVFNQILWVNWATSGGFQIDQMTIWKMHPTFSSWSELGGHRFHAVSMSTPRFLKNSVSTSMSRAGSIWFWLWLKIKIGVPTIWHRSRDQSTATPAARIITVNQSLQI